MHLLGWCLGSVLEMSPASGGGRAWLDRSGARGVDKQYRLVRDQRVFG